MAHGNNSVSAQVIKEVNFIEGRLTAVSVELCWRYLYMSPLQQLVIILVLVIMLTACCSCACTVAVQKICKRISFTRGAATAATSAAIA